MQGWEDHSCEACRGPGSYAELVCRFRKIVIEPEFSDRCHGGHMLSTSGGGVASMSWSGRLAWRLVRSRLAALLASFVVRRWVGVRALWFASAWKLFVGLSRPGLFSTRKTKWRGNMGFVP